MTFFMSERTCGCICSGIQVSQQRWPGVQKFADNAEGLFAHYCSRHRTCCSQFSDTMLQRRHVLNPRGLRPRIVSNKKRRRMAFLQGGRTSKQLGSGNKIKKMSNSNCIGNSSDKNSRTNQTVKASHEQQEYWCLRYGAPARPCSGRGGSAGEGQASLQGCASHSGPSNR